MSNIDLSIIIPLYNAEYYIKDCLSSLVSQNIDPERYEIIVINDGSKDNSLKAAKDFAVKYPNVRIIEQENQGVGETRNTGIEYARGAYIYFIDADDYLAHNTLNKVLDDALARDLDVLCFNRILTKERNLFLSKNLDSYQIDSQIHSGIDFIANHTIISSVWWFIVKKDFLLRNKLRFIKGIFWEDVIFSLELLLAAERISSTNLDVYRWYEGNSTSITHNKEAAHYNKTIKDVKYALIKLDEVINKLDPKNGNFQKCIEKIKDRQRYLILSLLPRLIKSPMSFIAFKAQVNELKNLGMYPTITHFPNQTNQTKARLSTKIEIYFVNRPFLLFPFTYIIKTFNLGKYLHR